MPLPPRPTGAPFPIGFLSGGSRLSTKEGLEQVLRELEERVEAIAVGGGVAGVATFNGRGGAVLPASGDYDAADITNTSGVAGSSVEAALDALAALIPGPAPVSSVHGRTGAVVSGTGDYSATQVTNDSGVSGSAVSDALDALSAAITARVQIGGQLGGTAASPDVRGIRESGGALLTFGAIADGQSLIRSGSTIVGAAGGGGAVASVFGRSGIVSAQASDYDAVQVDFTPDGDITASNAQAAIVEVRDDAAAALASHAGAANPHSGSLSTSHAGTGGTAHANAIASGAAGFMTGADKAKLDGIASGADVSPVASVHGRTGAVVAATSDYDAAQVDFTPDGDIAATDVQAALVEVRNDTDTKLGAKVQIGGQIGGTISSPDVRGIRESGGDLLTFGAIADGQSLIRSGSTVIGGSGSGGAVDSVHGRTGAVVAATSDYDAVQVDFTPDGDIAASNVQAALVEVRDDAAAALASHAGASNPHSGSLGTSHEGAGGAVHANAIASGAAGFMTGADKAKLDGVASGAAAVGAGVVGVGSANSDGASGTAARVDHVHAHGSQAGGTTHADAVASGAAGFMTGADKAKLDGVASGATNTPLSSTAPTTTTRATAVIGVGTTAARADHKHDISTGTPVAIGTANSAGSGTALALSNHVHSHGNQTTATHHAAATTSANGFMSSADKTKLDGITPAAAAVGGGIVGIGSANADGVSGTAARVDHVHAHGTQAGGTTHPDAIASGAAGFMSGSDKAKLDGIETAATADQVASEVPFTPNGDITSSNVQAALVELRDDTDTKLAAKVIVAGQIGGTAAVPDIRGLRSTVGGGTLLTMGDIADGEVLTRSGTSLIGSTPAGGGGGSEINEITGLSTARYYSLGSDPLNAVDQHTVCAVVRAGPNTASTSFNNRWVMGTIDGVGGFGIRYSGNFTADSISRLGVSFYDGGGTLREFEIGDVGVSLKLCVIVVVFNYDEFGNTTAEFFVNGQRHVSFFTSSVTGQTAGGNLTIGATDEGAYQHGLDEGGFLHGAAYATRLLDYDEVRELTEAILEANELVDIPGGGGSWTAAWRVGASEPGATWAPAIGSGSLTRTGTAATHNVRSEPAPY